MRYSARHECKSVEWWTPMPIIESVRAVFGGVIEMDPATHPSNPTQAQKFYTQQNDGLVQPWEWPDGYRNNIFCNPPYGPQLRPFLSRIAQYALRGHPMIVVLPVTARYDQDYWHECVFNKNVVAICFVRGRISFDKPLLSDDGDNGNNIYPTSIIGYNVLWSKFSQEMSKYGVVLKIGDVKHRQIGKSNP